jgi:hypothetical protein
MNNYDVFNKDVLKNDVHTNIKITMICVMKMLWKMTFIQIWR